MRLERPAVYALVVLLVLIRSLPFALYEQIQFDSDQAVFGLMAKHLSEGRAFPLLMYGQEYLLAVDAWLAAPWFLVAPPTLFTLSLSLILVNIAAAMVIVFALERWGPLRPWQAFAAALFVIVPPPIVAGDFVSVSGANVQPFLYVTALWIVRQRPFWFGAILAVGFLQREFTLYAVPILLLGDLMAGRLLSRQTIGRWLVAAVTCVAVWEGIQALQPYADMMGPGTRGQLLRGFAGSQLGNLMSRVGGESSSLRTRAGDMLHVHLPRVFGSHAFQAGRRHPRPVMTWILTVAFAAVAVRLLLLLLSIVRARDWPRLESAGFAWFALGVGVLSVVAFALARPVNDEHARYGLLALLIPVGLAAALFALETHVAVRRVVAGTIAAWAMVMTFDTARLYIRYRTAPPSNHRMLADALVSRNIDVASASYWNAYVVTFMTAERTKVASTDSPRIDEYQRLAEQAPGAVRISERPCDGDRVAHWYLCASR